MLLFKISKLTSVPTHCKLLKNTYNREWLWNSIQFTREKSQSLCVSIRSIMLKFWKVIWCKHLRYACSYTYIHKSYCKLQVLGVKKRGVEGMSTFRFIVTPTNYQTKPERLSNAIQTLVCVIPGSTARMIPRSVALTCFERGLWGYNSEFNWHFN